MSEQRHVIKRQVLELTVADQSTAYALQTEVSRIYRQRAIPLIERCCTELSAPDQIHRIETLEVDLGQLDADNLETDFLKRLTAILPEALAAHIQNNQHSAIESQLELIATFAQTGSLPWWADAGNTALLEDGLRALLQSSPDALRQLLRQLLHEPHAIERLVRAVADNVLTALISTFAPTLARTVLANQTPLLHVLRQIDPTLPLATRHLFFTTVLREAVISDPSLTRVKALLRDWLPRFGTELKLTYPALVAALYERLPATATAAPLQPMIEVLYQEQAAGKTPDASEPLSVLWDTLTALVNDLPEPLATRLLASLKLRADAAPAEMAAALATFWAMLRKLLMELPEPLASHVSLVSDVTYTPISDTEIDERPEMLLAALRETIQKIDQLLAEWPAEAGQAPPEPVHLDRGFSDATEVYVSNAGLVLLWPFLETFFTRLALVTDHQFVDDAAVQRSVGLLQYLATGGSEFPEYVLPLNKLLCGLDPDALFELEPPLEDDEMAECVGLLEAVIAHAEILRDMSVAGLRHTFLLRQGVLSTRDAAWLLQVERETYDVVLDRFPWGWEWVKLPWMDMPLRVEW